MPNIELEEAIKIAAVDEFWAVRGKAIQSYANLEQAMASLFAALAGVELSVAATIFFKIASADARNKIVEALFRKKFADRFNTFRNSLFDQLRPIDAERNEVVHWSAACQVGHDGTKTTAVVVLTPANIFNSTKPPIKTTTDLRNFIAKSSFYARLVSTFAVMECAITKVPVPDDARRPWRDIFARPIIYPPPSEHPLFQNPQALENQIQAFLV